MVIFVVIGGVVVVCCGIATLSLLLKCVVVVGVSQTMVTGGLSLSCVSARWVRMDGGWGTDHGVPRYTMTTNDECCSSFGCHITEKTSACRKGEACDV